MLTRAQFADLRRLSSLKLKSILDTDKTEEVKEAKTITIIEEAVKKQFEPKSNAVQNDEEKYICKVRVASQ